ncbi:peptidoglycan-associated lipoprotein Pal [Tropicimonas sp. IMCC34011]|uniref:peptidoglycan-associated lipoprotein Pal n=1 Tax=Tropicimonas sp. IMCC34011 TaxID=2248759 RepID=UPI000E27C2A4|nr:peptidoglycan-associated lipoprotein Pal [Tropicimonas sp. IMCC34011]
MARTAIKALVILSALGLGACQNADRFGDGTMGGGPGGPGTVVDPLAGGANDPTSTAYFQQTIGDRVLFPVDQSTLTGEARNTLTQQAQWMQRNPEYAATVEGHADEQGTREYNLALGARRANSVQEYLISQGVAGSRLKTVSYGKERPIEVCSTEACYSRNRRAVTVLNASGGAGF